MWKLARETEQDWLHIVPMSGMYFCIDPEKALKKLKRSKHRARRGFLVPQFFRQATAHRDTAPVAVCRLEPASALCGASQCRVQRPAAGLRFSSYGQRRLQVHTKGVWTEKSFKQIQ